MWYGIKKHTNSRTTYLRKVQKINLKLRTLSFLIPFHKNLNYGSTSIYIPNVWSFNLLTSTKENSWKLLYLYSAAYYFKLIIPATHAKIIFDNQSSVLCLKYWLVHNYFYLYTSIITFIFYSFSRIVFTKLKFKGKGYYIYKTRRNTITPQFGHSHRIYVYAPFISIKFLSKTSIFVFGLSKRDLLETRYQIKQLKPINIFTGRGVRFTREIIYKKVGKVSSYR